MARQLLLSVSARCCQCQTARGFLYSSKKGMSRDTLAWMLQPLDFSFSGMLRWWRNRIRSALIEDHRFVAERHEMLGADLAAAHFVVTHGGAVRFEGHHRWIKRNQKDSNYSLPSVPSADTRLEAVDVSDSNMMYISFDNFVALRHLKYLSVAGCVNIDDWCLDRFVQFRDSLLVLDISRCPHVTERGLAALHKLTRLRRLRMYDMPAVQHKRLTALLLEDVLPAGCVIEGVNFDSDDSDSEQQQQNGELPVFMKRYEEMAFSEERQRADLVKQDRQLAGIDDTSPPALKDRKRDSG